MFSAAVEAATIGGDVVLAKKGQRRCGRVLFDGYSLEDNNDNQIRNQAACVLHIFDSLLICE
jgi:hypothetical protein